MDRHGLDPAGRVSPSPFWHQRSWIQKVSGRYIFNFLSLQDLDIKIFFAKGLATIDLRPQKHCRSIPNPLCLKERKQVAKSGEDFHEWNELIRGNLVDAGLDNM
jgi:hypothetical protein